MRELGIDWCNNETSWVPSPILSEASTKRAHAQMRCELKSDFNMEIQTYGCVQRYRQRLKTYHRPKACVHCIVHVTRKCDCVQSREPQNYYQQFMEGKKILKTNLPRVYREVGRQWRWISPRAISRRCASNGAIVNCTSAAGSMIPLHFSKLTSTYCSQHWTTTSSVTKLHREKHI
jgi:hypothetical protein